VLLVIIKICKKIICQNEVLNNKNNVNTIFDINMKTSWSLLSEACKGKSLSAFNEDFFKV